MKKHYKILVSSAALLLPALALAQSVDTIFGQFINLINRFLIPALFAVAGLIFLWGVFRYITSGGDEEKRAEGQKLIVWGLVGLAIMVGFWGLVNAVVSFFGLNTSTIQNLPTVPTTR